ncbi:MAG: hypothetical protein AAGA92_02650 [Planctomycetota bacterium]
MTTRRFTWTAFAACVVFSTGCAGRLAENLPPAQRIMEPGPGVGGPGPGVIGPGAMGGGVVPASAMMGGMGMPGMGMPPVGPGCPPGAGMGGPGSTSQIAFLGVEGGQVAWDVSGRSLFDSAPLVMPGRQNFPQGSIYRLKLTSIPDRPGVELYPTIEVAPVTPRTDAFLAHSPVPIQFTDEDLDQVLSGNYVTKVIYLPDPEFQELALSGVETLVSTRLDPGVDPIHEADRRGSILAILRIGNLDLQLPGQMMGGGGMVQPVQYEGGYCPDGNCQPGYDAGYGGGAMVPQGMPTANFAPQVAPPGVVSGVNGPAWGMPITGTPIGLPGPPHIPLGSPAGLTKHTIKNRTKVLIPPPVHNMTMTVKQRPGMSYPRPVNKVRVSEVNRAPVQVFGGTLPPALPTALKKLAGRVGAKGDDCGDQECQ